MTNTNHCPLNYPIIVETLLSNPLVEDCYLLTKEQELIAYVVYTGPWNADELSAYLQSKLPDQILPTLYVPIFSLPLTEMGDVDEIALKNIPIFDKNLIKNIEEQLQTLPEIEKAAVIITAPNEQNPPLHLSDLLPLKPQTPLESNQALETETHSVVDSSPSRLAISHGQALIASLSQPQTLGHVLQTISQTHKNQGITYIKSKGSPIFQTYQQLWEEAQKIHTGLEKLGLQPQAKVLFQLSENSDIITAFWGCILGGFIPIIISVPATYKDLNHDVNKICQIWELLDQPLIITNQAQKPEIQTLEKYLSHQPLELAFIEHLKANPPHDNYHPSQPEDIAFFNLTSGSTGLSKCIALTHKNLLSRARGTNLICDHNQQDIILNWLPFDHIGSISDWHIRCVDLGCQMVYVQTEYILGRPLNWLDLIDQYRITHSWAPNFAYNLINESLKKETTQSWNLDCVKFFLVAGEAVSNQAVGEFINQLHHQYHLNKTTIRPAFGMAEMGSGITYYQPTVEQPLLFHTVDKSCLNQPLKRVHPEHPQATTFTDLGLPIPGISIRIVDQDNDLLPEENIGHLQVKGEPVFPGYYKNTEANQAVFLDEGWFKTGDLGFISHGHLVITGRSKETLIINGVNYYSHEIETIVDNIETVEASYTAACAVHDSPSNTDKLAIFFSVENSTSDPKFLGELIKKIRQQVINRLGVNPDYLIPLAKPEIPKTSIGKIQRSQLSQRFEAGEFLPIIKAIDILLENANTVPNWFYRKVWKPQNPVYLKAESSPHTRLIFLDSLGLGDALVTQIQAQNLPVITVLIGEQFSQLSRDRYTLKPGDAQDYQQLIASLAQQKITLSHIIHLWNYQEYPGEIKSPAQLEKAQELGIYSLLFLVQSLAKTYHPQQTLQLLWVSSHSQLVRENDHLSYEKSPVLGLIKSLAAEIPWLNSRHLDLAIAPHTINTNYLLQELQILSREKEIAYRGNQRFIAGLEKVNLSPQNPQLSPFKTGGIYLITGGLGGIGVQVAQYLLKNYQARLVLLGQTALPDKKLWHHHLKPDDCYASKIQTLQHLEKLGGEVIYQALDVGNFAQLQQVVAQVQRQWHREIDGIIHLAGIYQDSLILDQTQENLIRILRPKVLGTWNLHQLFKESQTIFISFSSLASFFGGASLGSYAAANSFLEQLNHYQNAKKLLPSYCYSWTTWQETGMSQGYSTQSLTRSSGYLEMTIQQGLDSFVASLYAHQHQLMIGLDSSNPKIKRLTHVSEVCQKLTAYYQLKPSSEPIKLAPALVLKDRFNTSYECPLLPQSSFPLKDNGEVNKEQFLSQLQGQDHPVWVAPRNQTESQMAQIWQTVLNLSKISIYDNFFELGGHSLLASQVISRLRDIFSVELSLQTLLEYPTIAGLTQTIEVINTIKNSQNAIMENPVNYEEGEF